MSPESGTTVAAAEARGPWDTLATIATSQGGMVLVVFASGAIGGLVAWVLEESTGGHLFPWSPLLSIAAALLLGGVAAGIGVYVLAKTDLRQLGGALFFALLCGIFFKPVLKAGKDFVGGAVARSEALSTAGDVQKSTSELSQSIGAGAPAKVEESVKKVADVTADLLDKSANVPDSDAKKSLETKSAEAVEALSTAAPHSPEATVDGLTKIGLRAEATGQHRIQSQVVSSLQQIERTNPNTEAGRLARESLKRLGRKLF